GRSPPAPRGRGPGSRSITIGAGRSLSFGASAVRRRAGSAVAARSVTVRPHQPPPTRRPASATLRSARPPRPRPAALRRAKQPVEQDAERAAQRELVTDRLRELERLEELGPGPAPAN